MIQDGNDQGGKLGNVTEELPRIDEIVERSPIADERQRVMLLRTDASDPNRCMMTAARLVHSTNKIRNLAWILLGLLSVTVFGLAFLPWRQSARGDGRVIAYRPGERQQTIQSPTKGVVANVPDYLVEGAFVKKGEKLMEIRPFADNLGDSLDSQLANLNTKLETAQIKADAFKETISLATTAREAAISSAQQAIKSAEADLQAKSEALLGYKGNEKQAKLNYEREKGLVVNRTTSPLDAEIAEAKWRENQAKVKEGEQAVLAATAKVAEKEFDLNQKRDEAQAKVQEAEAKYQAAMGEAATAEKEILDLQIKQNELDRLEIVAPRDGYIQRFPAFAGGQTVKEGDYLLTFVPKTDDHAVELLVRGNDMPLVHSGDHVRLQFEGWPALQFSGWPAVAVGTFGGEVALVDPSDDGTGKFRVIIRPAPGEQWPSDAYLRQGVRANGWVMLGEVSVAYEIWRQLNGFPPVLPKDRN